MFANLPWLFFRFQRYDTQGLIGIRKWIRCSPGPVFQSDLRRSGGFTSWKTTMTLRGIMTRFWTPLRIRISSRKDMEVPLSRFGEWLGGGILLSSTRNKADRTVLYSPPISHPGFQGDR